MSINFEIPNLFQNLPDTIHINCDELATHYHMLLHGHAGWKKDAEKVM